MIWELRRISPSVWLVSGERFKVVLINNARRPSNRGAQASVAFAVFAVIAPYQRLVAIIAARGSDSFGGKRVEHRHGNENDQRCHR